MGMSYAQATPFVVHDPKPGFQPPAIVLQYDAATGVGVDWSKTAPLYVFDDSDGGLLRDAVNFLREGIENMTGRRLEVVNGNELSRGIVLTTLAGAPLDVREDPAVRNALRSDGSDAYNDREAFYMRSEAQRVLVVANTVSGLVCAVPELLESVGYEVLGMGAQLD